MSREAGQKQERAALRQLRVNERRLYEKQQGEESMRALRKLVASRRPARREAADLLPALQQSLARRV